MAQKIIKSSEDLAKAIRSRKDELGYTVEEAAAKACVGTKFWDVVNPVGQSGAISTEESVEHLTGANYRLMKKIMTPETTRLILKNIRLTQLGQNG